MKGIGDDKAEDAPKKTVTAVAPKAVEKIASPEHPIEEAIPTKPEKKFEGKGLAGVVKKLSEEKLEDKAKRITDKLEKNPDKKDKVVEKEKKVMVKKTTKEDKPSKEDKPVKKTTKK